MLAFFSVYDTQRFVRLNAPKIAFLWWALFFGVLVAGLSKIVVQKSYVRHEKLHTHLNFNARASASDLLAYQSRQECAVVTSWKRDGKRSNATDLNVEFKVFHSVHDSGQFHVNGKALKGELLAADGVTVMKEFPQQHALRLKFDEIMRAANMSLDAPSTVMERDGKRTHSWRETGFELIVLIEYTDAAKEWTLFGLGRGEMRYVLSIFIYY